MYTRFCATLSKLSLMLAVAGLIVLIACVQYQVIGRYVFNDTPTWAEALALLLVLYITSLGVAVGVRDAGHIGMDSIISLLPERMRLKLEILIHGLVGSFRRPDGLQRLPLDGPQMERPQAHAALALGHGLLSTGDRRCVGGAVYD